MFSRTAIASFDELVAGLAKIRDAQVVNQLFRIFSAIGQMDSNELVTTYHTVETMRQLSEGKESQRLCDELKRSIIARMQHKIAICPSPMDSDNREILIELFTRVTGEKFKKYLM